MITQTFNYIIACNFPDTTNLDAFDWVAALTSLECLTKWNQFLKDLHYVYVTITLLVKFDIYRNLMYFSEKAMAPHSSTLAWKIPWTEDPGRPQSMGSLRVGPDWATSRSVFTFTFHFPALEKEIATHSSVLAWRIPGTGEPGGLPSIGSHRVEHDWSNGSSSSSSSNVFLFF